MKNRQSFYLLTSFRLVQVAQATLPQGASPWMWLNDSCFFDAVARLGVETGSPALFPIIAGYPERFLNWRAFLPNHLETCNTF